jgi:hypothetical protein
MRLVQHCMPVEQLRRDGRAQRRTSTAAGSPRAGESYVPSDGWLMTLRLVSVMVTVLSALSSPGPATPWPNNRLHNSGHSLTETSSTSDTSRCNRRAGAADRARGPPPAGRTDLDWPARAGLGAGRGGPHPARYRPRSRRPVGAVAQGAAAQRARQPDRVTGPLAGHGSRGTMIHRAI